LTTTLYRFFDADNRLLYVGVSEFPWFRWKTHKACVSWWEVTHHITLEHFQYREQALAAEKAAIQTDRPVFNRMHRAADIQINQAEQPFSRDQIVDAFREAARGGRLRNGGLLPPVPVMCERFLASRATVRAAMKVLESEGITYGAPARQWIVRPQNDERLTLTRR
jgi:DNA-binding transcriptional regulator YhcF (GntR family)